MEYRNGLCVLYDLQDERAEVLYKGLSLLEEKTFDGPTSVKYWM